ncbi:hypothetical protein L489_0924 [Bordetella bronchiseptica 00-P-2730]|nr:hypothetical protein L489_0924 [Bordetella bronchiseptica 00-P-2730]
MTRCLSPHGDWHLQDFMASARVCACPRWDRHIAVRHPGCLSPHGDWHLQDFMASARACACPRWDRHTAVRHRLLPVITPKA